jgi:hypothetical protein
MIAPAAADSRFRTRAIAFVLRPAIWFVVLAAVGAIKLGSHPYRHSSFFIYRAGAEAWLAGGSPYRPTPYPPEARIDEPPLFRYSPPFAAALIPFAATPIRAASVVWIAGSIAAYYFACRSLWRAARPAGIADGSGAERIFFLVAAAGAIRPTLSGNAHVLSAAGMVYALAAAIEGRFGRAAWGMPFPVFAKAAPLVFGGFLALARPRSAPPKFLAAGLLSAATPVLVAGPSGAAEVYREWFAHLGESHGDRWPSFRDLWLVWELTGLPFSLSGYRVLQAALGLATLCAVLRRLRAGDADATRLVAVTGLAQVYLMLCGPAVEFTQFVVLAPWLGLAAAEAARRPAAKAATIAAVALCFVLGNSPVEKALVAATGSEWPRAACTLGALVYGVAIVRGRIASPRPA